MFDKVIPDNTVASSVVLLDTYEGRNRILMAGAYKIFSDRYIGTVGGKSYTFGDNGLTLPFHPAQAPGDLMKAFPGPKTTEKNLAAIKFLDEWFSEPDDLGEVFWREFEKELEANRFRIP